jgi:hypothetical protein
MASDVLAVLVRLCAVGRWESFSSVRCAQRLAARSVPRLLTGCGFLCRQASSPSFYRDLRPAYAAQTRS